MTNEAKEGDSPSHDLDQAALLLLVKEGKEAWNKWVESNEGARVDFSNVSFDSNTDFGGFEFPSNTRFVGAEFEGGAWFNNAKFEGDVCFTSAKFEGDAGFRGAKFGGDAEFDGAKFGDAAWFDGAKFGGGTGFYGAKFRGDARFEGAKFGDGARFDYVEFGSSSGFEGAKFGGDAGFEEAKFGGYARFEGAKFGGYAGFGGAQFGGYARFEGVKFGGYARFEGAKFRGDAGFKEAKFGGDAGFEGAQFEGIARFERAKFGGHAGFDGAKFGGHAGFDGAQFGGHAGFDEAQFEGATVFRSAIFSTSVGFDSINLSSKFDLTYSIFRSVPSFQSSKNTEFIVLSNSSFSLGQPLGIVGRIVYFLTGLRAMDEDTVSKIRYLRGVASKTHAIDVERDLNILERKAQIGVEWAGLKQWPWRGFKQWCSHLLTAISGSMLMMLYGATSRYGRSIVLPFFWLAVSTIAYDRLYGWLYEKVRFIYSENAENISSSLLDFTITSMVPFGSNVRPTYQAAVDNLFPIVQTLPNGQILLEGRVPAIFQLVSLTQGVLTLVFVFLIGLALRNFFRMK